MKRAVLGSQVNQEKVKQKGRTTTADSGMRGGRRKSSEDAEKIYRQHVCPLFPTVLTHKNPA
ncbi:MAG: hypothetical protein HQL67_08525 [Magnetococcales bacterium]|nr:hypothetical protein [Magnetococcales bacterium]